MGEEKKEVQTVVVTEDELKKSIQALEAPPAKPEEKVTETVIETAPLAKTAQERIKEAPESLRKAFEVSATLTEFANLMGVHIDESLNTLKKSVQEGAERDHAFLRVVSDLKKSVETLTEEVKKLGGQPGKPAAAGELTVDEKGVLKKSTEAGDKKTDPVAARKRILTGLEIMAKSAASGSPEMTEIIHSTAKFESTGSISDEMLRKALAATKAA